MAKGTTLLDKNKNIVYPRTILEQVYNKAGTVRLDVLLSTMRENLEGDIADTNVVVARLRADLDALLSDSTLSGEVLDAIVEIKTLLDSNSSDVVAGLVETMSALRDEAVRNVAQELTLSQKQQARQNIDAAGVSATYGEGLATISFNGNAIYPETKGSQVKLSIGGNAEDAIKANGGNIEKERVRAIAREDEIATELAETKEKVDTFLADADTSADAIDKLKELQDYIKNDETSASQMLGDIAQNKNDIADNAEAIEKEATRAKQVEMYLESQKANKYGYYEGLSVGVSDNLSGRGEATDSEFTMRPSGGENKSIEDGTARINSIKGNSVVWNNLVRNSITHGSKYIVTKNDDRSYVVKVNPNFDGTTGNNWINDFTDKLENGHRYYFCIRYKVSGLSDGVTADLYLYDVSNTKSYGKTGITNGIGSYSVILDCDYTGSNNGKITPFIPLGELNAEFTIYGDRKCVDLTKMFNGVNVPATVEEFEALYGNMPNEYNAGEIKNNHTTAIKSVGVNAWDEEWELGGFSDIGEFPETTGFISKNFNKILPSTKYYMTSLGLPETGAYIQIGFWDKDYNLLSRSYVNNREFTTPNNACYFKIASNIGLTPPLNTYNHDICIHLVHTGYLNGKYFPYESQIRQLPTVEGGLKSAGTAYDEIRYNKAKDKWEHIQRVGNVDLGTLEWYYGNPSGNAKKVFYSQNVKTVLGITPAQGDNLKPNILSANYISKVPYDTLVVETINKAITAWANQAELYRIVVADTAYTDVATFKEAMQGVILYYELATPIVTELDVDISPDYKVWDYGTEEAISEVLSTPVRINANYGFNAVGQITDNTELIKELLARVAVLEAQVAQANSTNVEPIEPVVE